MKNIQLLTKIRIPSSLLIIGVFLAAPATAQEVAGDLHGRVADTMGSPLETVTVTVAGTGLPGERSVQTDARGTFRLLGLQAGTYTVHIRRIGYQPVIVPDVQVHLGRTAVLETIRLEPAAIELEPAVVTVERSVLDPTSSAIGANLTANTYAHLPVDRSYLSLLPLLPHANESFLRDAPNFSGSTGFENVYYIDGANVTDPMFTQSNPSLPYNFVQEVHVKQGGYQAEFGRALGGIVNVVTPSGGDEFRGSVFGFFTNEALAGTPRQGVLDAGTEGILNFDAGGSLGGPIIRRQLWFYAAYNVNIQGKDVQLPGLNFENARRTSHMFAGKVNWQAGENTDLALSVFGDPTTERVIGNDNAGTFAPVALTNPDPFLADANQGGYTAAARVRSLLSPRLLLEGTMARYQRQGDEMAATALGRTEPLFIDLMTRIWEGGRGGRSEMQSIRTSLGAAATVFIGTHTLKGGIEYEDNSVDVSSGISSTTASQSIGLILHPGQSSEFRGQFFQTDAEARNRIPAFFVQDSWQVTDRLTINAGLRWESQYFIGGADSVAQAITNQLQPRIGFAVEPGSPGSQKIFGSLGRYYQQFPLAVAVLVFGTGGQECSFEFDTDPRIPGVVPVSSRCIPLGVVLPKEDGIDGEHVDEFILGYERRLDDGARFGARIIRRELREAYGFGFDPTQPIPFVLGNPGKGRLDFLPRLKRDYTALGLTVERAGSGPLQFLASYVLSRTHGNYTGLFASDVNFKVPGNNLSLTLAEQARNSTGLLPNDRTHVFKLFGSYRFHSGLTVGTFFSLKSGTPLNEFEPDPILLRPLFLVERGSAGRTPALWDWDIRLTYDLLSLARSSRIIADVSNIGSPRRAALVEQFRNSGVDAMTGEQIPNPTFGQPLLHQSPISLRVGFEVGL
ncbi:MAG: carboxypeptidase regulatory-like domain-containing protein [Gemmatimonadota bacterium]